MLIPEELKINKYRDVRIPSKGEYFNTGRFNAIPEYYGGEENNAEVTGQNKVEDVAELMHNLDKERDSEDN